MKKLVFALTTLALVFFGGMMASADSGVEIALIAGKARVSNDGTNFTMLGAGAVTLSVNGIIQLAPGSVVAVKINGNPVKLQGPLSVTVAQLLNSFSSKGNEISRGNLGTTVKGMSTGDNVSRVTAVAGVRADEIVMDSKLPFIITDDSDDEAKKLVEKYEKLLNDKESFFASSNRDELLGLMKSYDGEYVNELRFKLAEVYQILGQYKEAKEIYENLLESDLVPSAKLVASEQYCAVLYALSDFSEMESFIKPLLKGSWEADTILRLHYIGVISALANKNNELAKSRLIKMQSISKTSSITKKAEELF